MGMPGVCQNNWRSHNRAGSCSVRGACKIDASLPKTKQAILKQRAAQAGLGSAGFETWRWHGGLVLLSILGRSASKATRSKFCRAPVLEFVNNGLVNNTGPGWNCPSIVVSVNVPGQTNWYGTPSKSKRARFRIKEINND